MSRGYPKTGGEGVKINTFEDLGSWPRYVPNRVSVSSFQLNPGYYRFTLSLTWAHAIWGRLGGFWAKGTPRSRIPLEPSAKPLGRKLFQQKAVLCHLITQAVRDYIPLGINRSLRAGFSKIRVTEISQLCAASSAPGL